MRLLHIDPEVRRARKAAARRLDDEALASGRIAPAAMRQRNFAFGHLDFKAARMVVEIADDPL